MEFRAARAQELPRCIEILRALPDWFGIPESIDDYAAQLPSLDTVVATSHEKVEGFATVKFHNADSAELYLIAVRQELHRQGIGTRLLSVVERMVLAQGCSFFQVKA